MPEKRDTPAVDDDRLPIVLAAVQDKRSRVEETHWKRPSADMHEVGYRRGWQNALAKVEKYLERVIAGQDIEADDDDEEANRKEFEIE